MSFKENEKEGFGEIEKRYSRYSLESQQESTRGELNVLHPGDVQYEWGQSGRKFVCFVAPIGVVENHSK